MAGEQRGPISDIERFLMEVERLRKRSAEEKGKASGPQDVYDVEVVRPAPRRAPPTPRQPPPVRRPVQRPRPRQAQEVQPVLDVIPVRQPPTPAVTAPQREAAPPEHPAPATRVERPVNPTLRLVVSMIRNKQQIRASMVVNELLGPPLSKRRFRGRR